MNKKKTYLYAAIIAIGLVACSGNTDNSQITTWIESPITQMSVMELIIVILICGIITR